MKKRNPGKQVVDSRQGHLFDVRQFRPRPYEPTSFFGLLEEFGELLIRRDDFPPPVASGAPLWCRVLMSKLVLIQRKHGWTDRETVDRATNDLRVKACLGLGVEQEGPSQAKLSTHRKRMRELGVLDVYEQRFVELLEALELLERDEALLVDSVPVRGAGQVLDTYNLLAAAIRQGLKRLADATGESSAEVARRLELDPFVSRGIKGKFEVDWEDPESRRVFLAKLVGAAQLVLEAIDAQVADEGERREPEERDAIPPDAVVSEQGTWPGVEDLAAIEDDNDGERDDVGSCDDAAPGEDADDEPPPDGGVSALAGTAEVLRDIIASDVKVDADGEVVGIVEKKQAGDRIISVTDPDMRHGRKSASVLISGYKAQIIATVIFGWILLAKVFRANGHDGHGLPEQVDSVRERYHLETPWVGGDHAYGTIANHAAFADPDRPELIARMARPANGGRFTKDEFGIDLASATLTCPAGYKLLRTKYATRQGRKGWLFEFPADVCGACPSRTGCVSPKANPQRRSVFVVPAEERLIRAHLERREEPDFNGKLAQRVHVERVIAGFAQCGGKQARRHGQDNVDFDVRISALAYNLRRLGSVLKERPELREKLRQILAAKRSEQEDDAEDSRRRSPSRRIFRPTLSVPTWELIAFGMMLALLLHSSVARTITARLATSHRQHGRP